jgi:hypothetical protein
MMNRRCPDHVREASERTLAQLGLADRIDLAGLADGSRDGAAGITLKPYPPVLGFDDPDNEQAAGSLRFVPAYGNRRAAGGGQVRPDPLTV